MTSLRVSKEFVRVQQAQYRKRRYLYGPAQIDPTGSRRRLQALMAAGWSGPELSRRLGGERSLVDCTLRYAKVGKYKADRISSLYVSLCKREPPLLTPDDRRRATKARNAARKNGWLPPSAWDDDIDEPEARPTYLTINPLDYPVHVRREVVVDLLAVGGLTLSAIAIRSGLDRDEVRRIQRQLRREMLADEDEAV